MTISYSVVRLVRQTQNFSSLNVAGISNFEIQNTFRDFILLRFVLLAQTSKTPKTPKNDSKCNTLLGT